MFAKLTSVPASLDHRTGESRPLVMVVDDDEDARADVRDVLLDQGYEVVEAAHGKEALDYLVVRRDRVPDVLLLDLTMPVMTGWELLAVLKAYVRLARIPVVLLSGVEPELDHVRHGVIAAYLRKPCRAPELLDAVARALPPTLRLSASG